MPRLKNIIINLLFMDSIIIHQKVLTLFEQRIMMCRVDIYTVSVANVSYVITKWLAMYLQGNCFIITELGYGTLPNAVVKYQTPQCLSFPSKRSVSFNRPPSVW